MSAPFRLSALPVLLLVQLGASSLVSLPRVSPGRLRVLSELQAAAATAQVDDARRQFDAGRYAEAAGTLESLAAADTGNAERQP